MVLPLFVFWYCLNSVLLFLFSESIDCMLYTADGANDFGECSVDGFSALSMNKPELFSAFLETGEITGRSKLVGFCFGESTLGEKGEPMSSYNLSFV